MDNIINTPHIGWCHISLPFENELPTVSYLTDVHIDTLQAFLDYLDHGAAAVEYDCEEYGQWLIVMSCGSLIVEDIDGNHASSYQMNESEMLDLILRCYDDFKENIGEWIYWRYDENDSEFESETRIFKEKMKEAAALLYEYDKVNIEEEMLSLDNAFSKYFAVTPVQRSC